RCIVLLLTIFHKSRISLYYVAFSAENIVDSCRFVAIPVFKVQVKWVRTPFLFPVAQWMKKIASALKKYGSSISLRGKVTLSEGRWKTPYFQKITIVS